MPGSAAVQVSVPISAFASGYKNSAFIADQICPIIHTDFAKGTYFTYLKSDTADVVDDLIGEETRASGHDTRCCTCASSRTAPSSPTSTTRLSGTAAGARRPRCRRGSSAIAGSR